MIGRIAPDTTVENDYGEKGAAGDIPSLFPGGVPAQAVPPAVSPTAVPVTPAANQPAAPGIYCAGCGHHLERDMPFCPYCGSDTAKNNRFCHKCGKPLYAGQVVCSECGNPVYIPDDGSSPLSFSS